MIPQRAHFVPSDLVENSRESHFDTSSVSCSNAFVITPVPRFVDFFAGSGLVTQGVKHACVPLWSNDICPKKAAIYQANHGSGHFRLGSIEQVRGGEIPVCDIIWASFPCQDLSLAGKMGGLAASRSGLFWEWLRVLDEMVEKPAVIALENVVGLLSANAGNDFRMLYHALRERSYKVGPMLLDARHWVPQSRPRVFIVAARNHVNTSYLEDNGPNWLHADPVRKAIAPLDDIVFWSMPHPKARAKSLGDLVDWDAPVFEQTRAEALFSIIAPNHRELLDKLPRNQRAVFPGYRRTRHGKQVLELRFDNLSGCLRTAEGGSSRQFLILHDKGHWSARLITPREAALLMGAPRSYKLSSSYNESYNAMGDAVVVPVVKHLVDHLFIPIIQTVHDHGSCKSASQVRLIA
ncbi:MAG: DNA (cytosine-5-)-methyltransferase [Verrucomicrobia bacterium]|nr:MAG: DNA (cytosine-5-)-methyltransferase [Verrucomicrobiota bacterium]TAE88517.1 MAG: DNA (cytosine-5-)-methyltransferase [Verrucomicrobiota bacterium]TAF26972.1 MAG: DNA (cytosine-5-)-methyltransferase [Verrucomicrobiota bacterium]TAF42228.1 MAG: DNA (cytosine-5-)-methyltransferase [Verrucomicrobiota bacterium]